MKIIKPIDLYTAFKKRYRDKPFRSAEGRLFRFNHAKRLYVEKGAKCNCNPPVTNVSCDIHGITPVGEPRK